MAAQNNMQERTLAMEHLRSDVESQRYSTTKNSVYSKLTATMQAKYGAFSNGVKWKRGWFGL